MEDNGLQTDCILNNADKFALVCGQWIDDDSDATIASDQGLTVTQVQYFTNLCPLASLTDTIKTLICESLKDSGKTLDEVKATYPKYIVEEIETEYAACTIQQYRQDLICADKTYGIDTVDLVLEWGDPDGVLKLYPTSMIQSVLDNCPLPELSASEKYQICIRARTLTYDNSFFAYYKDTYGEDAVAETYCGCSIQAGGCPTGDAQVKKSS